MCWYVRLYNKNDRARFLPLVLLPFLRLLCLTTTYRIVGATENNYTKNNNDNNDGRGLFASALAEHVVLSCLYFAKDVDRWKRNQKCRKWERYHVAEVLTRKTSARAGLGGVFTFRG